jgi:hypothetical protein
MRIFLKFLLGLVGFVAFLAMGASATFWAYGQYGVPLINEQLANVEVQVEESIEEEYPGSVADVHLLDVFYKIEGTSAFVAFKVDADVTFGGILDHTETNYAVIDVMSVISGAPEYVTYTESEWETASVGFNVAPAILFDGEEAKKWAITVFVISAVAFVGSIVVSAVFLRKKKV